MSPIPDLPRDNDVVTEQDLSVYVSALERNGFYGPSSWYMNHRLNAEYSMTAQNGGYLDMPASTRGPRVLSRMTSSGSIRVTRGSGSRSTLDINRINLSTAIPATISAA